MALIMDILEELINRNSSAASMSDEALIHIYFHVALHLETSENEIDESYNQQKKDLLNTVEELGRIIMNLWKQKVLLINIELKETQNFLNRIKELNEKTAECLASNDNTEEAHEIFKLQLKLECMVSQMKEVVDLEDNRTFEEIMDGIHKEFLSYRKGYQKCELYVKLLLSNAKKVLKITNTARIRQAEFGNLFSLLEENIDSYKFNLGLSKKEFREFKVLFKKSSIATNEDIEIRTDLVTDAIVKAKASYVELKGIVFGLLSVDRSIHALLLN